MRYTIVQDSKVNKLTVARPYKTVESHSCAFSYSLEGKQIILFQLILTLVIPGEGKARKEI